jgi:hypothetical protein
MFPFALTAGRCIVLIRLYLPAGRSPGLFHHIHGQRLAVISGVSLQGANS